MMMKQSLLLILFLSLICFCASCQRNLSEHLVVQEIESTKSDYPALFDTELKKAIKQMEHAISSGIDVPVPVDMAGGYTHQQHKLNWKLMLNASSLYKYTQDEKYADFVKEMLFAYSELYPTLGLHPTNKSYATGKLFWQCLNDANWLVFASQAYDGIYDYLTVEEHHILEHDLFIPMANFLSEENPKFFNRIHNHSTWANAAVGMIAIVMKNDTLLQKALYGLDHARIDANIVDNDGGYILKDGIQQAGFLAQLDYSFSPDGYFTEGPYYQRYAIFPFLAFSQALHENKPELDIFNYRDQIIQKAIRSLLKLTDPSGVFYPINDSQKGMNYTSYEIITAVNLMYYQDPSQKDLLDWAYLQNSVTLSDAGLFVAEELERHSPRAPKRTSVYFGDGVDGKSGAVGVLRNGDTDLLFKFSEHGMGHGHFDRLSYAIYDASGEVSQDYGAARWVNVDQKAGGRYLPENRSFAKQTIAHNSIVINQESQFKAKVRQAESAHAQLYYKDLGNKNVQMISAIETDAYDGVTLHRTLLMVEDAEFSKPLVIELSDIKSLKEIDIDLPFWFVGHHMKSSFQCEKDLTNLEPLGKKYGYQHIWKESACEANSDGYSFNWYGNEQFYTIRGVSNAQDQMIFGRVGANDPNFNLRPDPVFIHRKEKVKEAIFFRVIETHGSYDRVSEFPVQPYSKLKSVDLVHYDENYIICEIKSKNQRWILSLCTNNKNDSKKHQVRTNDGLFEWTGVYLLTKK